LQGPRSLVRSRSTACWAFRSGREGTNWR
jgi:hypothetical protein